jgi:uncharacterized membrane protein
LAADGAHRVIQWVLRGGLAASVVLMLAGFALKMAGGDASAPAVPIDAVLAPLDLADRLMVLGVLILGLTPAARVLALVGLWARERDWRFAGVAVTVLAVLAVAALLGRG